MRPRKAKYLFDHLEEVRRQLQPQDRIALFLDLDGTLASITPTPRLTKLNPQTRFALRTLVQDRRYRVVIVSGRQIKDLENIVRVPEVIYVGNHGLEIEGSGLRFRHIEAEEQGGAIAAICKKLRARLPSIAGTIIEFKNLSASVHFRLVSATAVERVRSVVDETIAPFLDQVRLTEGKQVLELRPAVDWDKGSAVVWILSQFDHDAAAAIYMGDDRTDEDAFVALPKSITINVGPRSGTAARYFVRSPQGVLAFIVYLPLVSERSGTSADVMPVGLPASAGH
jgi:trehalose 6-phosphate phosphatase